MTYCPKEGTSRKAKTQISFLAKPHELRKYLKYFMLDHFDLLHFDTFLKPIWWGDLSNNVVEDGISRICWMTL
jgi:hypothetical protein